MKKIWSENGLSISLLSLFILFLLGQLFTGISANNFEQELRGQASVGLAAYLASGHFWEALFENLESEFLQMGAFVILTVFLVQKGSSQSNDPDEPEQHSPESKPVDAPYSQTGT